ncbi:MAG: hypothetical protein ACTSVB_06000 [Candidatus Heimdallarchaeaceae archaeon]
MRYEYDDTNGLKVYMYIKAASAISNGDVVTFGGTTGYTVKVDTTNAPAKFEPVGVGIGTITNGYYGYILVRGYHSAVKKVTDATTSAYKAAYVLSGKIKTANGGATDTAFYQVGGIIPLESKACSCTTVKAFVKCL